MVGFSKEVKGLEIAHRKLVPTALEFPLKIPAKHISASSLRKSLHIASVFPVKYPTPLGPFSIVALETTKKKITESMPSGKQDKQPSKSTKNKDETGKNKQGE